MIRYYTEYLTKMSTFIELLHIHNNLSACTSKSDMVYNDIKNLLHLYQNLCFKHHASRTNARYRYLRSLDLFSVAKYCIVPLKIFVFYICVTRNLIMNLYLYFFLCKIVLYCYFTSKIIIKQKLTNNREYI